MLGRLSFDLLSKGNVLLAEELRRRKRSYPPDIVCLVYFRGGHNAARANTFNHVRNKMLRTKYFILLILFWTIT
jgi:hypothetical protein